MGKFRFARNKANEIVMESLADVHNVKDEICVSYTKHRKMLTIVGCGFVGITLGLLFAFGFTETALASDPGAQVFQRANTAMQGVLRQVRLISSIIAALFLTLAFLMKMLSKNQRTVDEANTWIKRIAIAWACINAVGFILTFIQEIIGPDVALPTI